jgi:predicted RNase H-like nuclease (RuvC/YqgF family)
VSGRCLCRKQTMEMRKRSRQELERVNASQAKEIKDLRRKVQDASDRAHREAIHERRMRARLDDRDRTIEMMERQLRAVRRKYRRVGGSDSFESVSGSTTEE